MPRRTLLLILSAVLVALVAASCGEDDPGVAPEPADEPDAPAGDPAETPDEEVDEEEDVAEEPDDGEFDVIRSGNNIAIVDAQLAWQLVGVHEELGFYEEERIEVEIVQTGGTAGAWAGIQTGGIDIGPIGTPAHLGFVMEDPDHPGISAYNWLQVPHWFIGVLPDSDIQSYEDLEGRRIGIRDEGDTGYFGVRGMLTAAGLDPDEDVEFVTVGPGAPGGVALEDGDIDALAHWDAEYARIENAGFEMRYVGDPLEEERYAEELQMPGNTWVINRDSLEENPDLWVRYFRALARSTEFFLADWELAVELHWELFPEAIPPGIPYDQALAEAVNIMEIRGPRLDPSNSPDPDERYGWQSEEQWANLNDFFEVGYDGEYEGTVFSTELIDEANDFDRQEVRDLAEEIRANR